MSMPVYTSETRRLPAPRARAVQASNGRSTTVPPRQQVLVVVRWPVGGIRTHLVYNYPTVAQLGYEFTFVGPADDGLTCLEKSFPASGKVQCIGVPVRGRRCS